MAENEEITNTEERELKMQELEIRINHYKYYVNVVLQTNVFFFVLTGGVLAYYLQYSINNVQIPPISQIPPLPSLPKLEFFLLLPILIGSVLGGIFIHGAKLQTKAAENIDDVRDELRNRLRLNVRKLHDAHLLVKLLWTFSLIFFLVVVALLFVPLLLENVNSLELFRWETFLIQKGLFYLVAILIIISGFVLLPYLASLTDIVLKELRYDNLLKTLLRTELWLYKCKDFDFVKFKRQDFYYDLQLFLKRKMIENLYEDGKENSKASLIEEIKKLRKDLIYKFKLGRKLEKRWWLGQKIKEWLKRNLSGSEKPNLKEIKKEFAKELRRLKAKVKSDK